MYFIKKSICLSFLGVFFLANNSIGQYEKFNLISKKIYINKYTFKVDTFSINPRTFKIYDKNNNQLDPSEYKLNSITGEILFNKIFNDSLTFIYHPFYFNLKNEYFKHDIKLNRPTDYSKYNPIYVSSKNETNNQFEGTNLNKTGSISRGLIVGNNQDFSLNSNLNLQLSGNISPEIKILASVTDDNIPIQPQGNTQQLQDFDQVYIQVFNDKWKLTTGDFWVKNKNGYFLKYHKRGQGIHLENKITNNKGYIIKTENSISLSKGKFARNVIQGVEGNQGPYRLNGNENETYIIVLSGTENVYIDGKLLKRGQNYDYIIDYNTSEIIFTANNLITKDKRIIVEFQYSDKNYARSLIQSGTSFTKNNNSFYINAYAEQDSKNQPLQQDIDLEDRFLLEQIGDSIDQAITSGIDSTTYNDGFNMYEKIDSLGYTFYKFSTNPDSAHYQITFSEVGQGNGNYIIDEYNALGKVFKWIAPDTINSEIIRNGNYAPIKKLITPKKRQLINIGGNFNWANKKITYELSSSNKDINTLSEKDNNDNIGFAGFTKLNIENKINDNWNLNQEYRIEAVEKNFNRIERFRAVEFERNWNIQQLTIDDNQLISSGKFNLKHDENGQISYQLNSYIIEDNFKGNKNDLNINWNKLISLKFKGSILQSGGIQKTNFIRHKTDLFIPIKKIGIGFKDINENNKFYTFDTLNNNSYRFYDWKVYLANTDSVKNNIQFYYQERYDWFKNQLELQKATKAISPGFNVSLIENKDFKINYNLAYRSLQIIDTTLTNINAENSLTSRLNYQLKLLKGGIYTNSFIELGSGLELQKEFIFLEVTSGQGIYTWNDYNEDGIKDLNEFEIAVYSDQANYIKVFTPNNNYQKIYNFQFNQNLNIDPRKIFDSKKIIGKATKKFYNQIAINTQKKTNNLDFETLLNPLVDSDNPIIQSMSNNIRNSLFFNRSNPKYSLEYVTQLFANKNLLINGTDFRSTKKNQLKIRWNLNKFLMLKSEYNNGFKSNTSTYALNRNFNISEIETINKFSFQPNTLFRLSINARYCEKKNAVELGNENSYISDFGLELRRSKRDRALINAEINLVNIDYNGVSNSAIGFEMLEGLQDGKNVTWKLSLQKNMSNNVQLSINYNGRKSENNKTIHTGGMQLRAFF
tara:strand:+ start:1938 stop:5384 length:3447 start_codon:yes stop_codon:yes gene_type:complete